MTLDSLTRNARRAALACALSLSFALTFSSYAHARAPEFFAGARAQDSKAAQDADGFERAKRMLAEGDAKGAAARLKSVAEARKTDADAWHLLGVALSRAGDNKEARKAFEKSVKLRPSYADAHAGLAYALLVLGKPDEANLEARLALELSPQVAEAHYVVGVTLYRADKFMEALDEAETALRIKPTLGAAAYLAGDALMALYFDESERQTRLYPISRGATDEERKAAEAKRDPALEPVRARMRENAARLETIIAAQPDDPEAKLWREQAGSMRFFGRAEGSGVFRPSEVTSRAVILSKPEPGYTSEAQTNLTSGVVKLRAVLAADGRVRNISIVSTLPDGLTELCIRAARRIKFKPAQKDGHAVSQYVTLEYHFN